MKITYIRYQPTYNSQLTTYTKSHLITIVAIYNISTDIRK